MVTNVLHLKDLDRSDAGAVLECRAENGGGVDGVASVVVTRVVLDMIREFGKVVA